jgi:hypothetical protein
MREFLASIAQTLAVRVEQSAPLTVPEMADLEHAIRACAVAMGGRQPIADIIAGAGPNVVLFQRSRNV